MKQRLPLLGTSHHFVIKSIELAPVCLQSVLGIAIIAGYMTYQENMTIHHHSYGLTKQFAALLYRPSCHNMLTLHIILYNSNGWRSCQMCLYSPTTGSDLAVNIVTRVRQMHCKCRVLVPPSSPLTKTLSLLHLWVQRPTNWCHNWR